ncbi:MAG: disulfide bond formation protein DsbA [Gammaproteobacteria bacterium]|nr:disulfide bond formation protein DsbA [Gammaproteobacteria bacterium]
MIGRSEVVNSKSVELFLIFAYFIFLFSPSLYSADLFEYEEGVHYARLEVPIGTSNPEKIEVTEYFSYGCPHCFRFEPLISQWKSQLSSDVIFNRTPAIWNVPGYQMFARTYYTLEALDYLSKLHLPLFKTIHNNKRRLNDLEAIAEFVSEYGVDAETFLRTYNDSFGVTAKYQRAVARQKIYGARGVPALIVNGKYRIEGSMVGNSNLGMLQVADFLIEKERGLLAR